MTDTAKPTRYPSEPSALVKSINEVDAWLDSGQSLDEVENEESFIESVFLIVNQMQFMRAERDALAARVAELEAAQVAVVKPLEGGVTMTDGAREEISAAMHVYRMQNMYESDGDNHYALIDLFTPEGCDVGEGIGEISRLADFIASTITLRSEQDVRNEALEDAAANCSDMADKLERNALAKGDPHGIQISMAAILEERATAIRAMKGGGS